MWISRVSHSRSSSGPSAYSRRVLARAQSLTSTAGPQRLCDLERLYHSCRFNGEVTAAALDALERAWLRAATEPARLRILCIVDRLLCHSGPCLHRIPNSPSSPPSLPPNRLLLPIVRAHTRRLHVASTS